MHPGHYRRATVASLLLSVAAMPAVGEAPQDQGQAGPAEVTRCQTIDKPGSYRLVNNLQAAGDCLVVTAEGVTIDLAGFALTGNGTGTGIKGPKAPSGVIPEIRTVVRNGGISHFDRATDLAGTVERTVVTSNHEGIVVSVGIVRGNTSQSNTVTGIAIADGLVDGNLVIANGTGIQVQEAAVVTGNEVSGNQIGIDAKGIGSAVTVNVVGGNHAIGLRVHCPSNLINNTVVGSPTNLVLSDSTCHTSDNLAP
jgi:hypothetical protein